MRNTISFFTTLLLATACQQPGEPTTSVDGLTGGTITSNVAVPTLTADSVDVGDGAFDLVDAIRVEAEDVAATRVEVETISTSKLVVRGLPVFGVPLGAIEYTPSPNSDAGYRHADDACRAAFTEEAHVCSADEALAAFRSGIDLAESLDGAAVNTHSFQVVGQEDNEAAASLHQRLFVVNDCDGWASGRQISSVRVQGESANAGTANLGVSPVQKWIDGHMKLFAGDAQNPTWRLRPDIDHCDEVKLACCG